MAELRCPDIEPLADAAELSVLVVDDQELNRRVMNILLKEFGCRAVLAASAEEGVELAAARRFDLIFMDLNMPGMDGDAATRLVRAEGLSKSSYIVRWTTEAGSARDLALYDGHAGKPVSVTAVAEAVAEVVRRRGRRPSGATPRLRPLI